MSLVREANFDGLVGPSHNYSGLSTGNLASMTHLGEPSKPKEAALQGLAKAEYLMKRGFLQGLLPPHARPNFSALRAQGHTGKDSDIAEKLLKSDPLTLSIACSASNMWTANAATFVPSTDSRDGSAHFVVANLQSKAHRAQEAPETYRQLCKFFASPPFSIHPALEEGAIFSDEGAANHTRLCDKNPSSGLHVFVYGRRALSPSPRQPKRFVARQSLEASQKVANLCGIENRSVFIQQNPNAIDAGVFHNDVICVGNQNLLFSHEWAFTSEGKLELQKTLSERLSDFHWIEVKESHVPLVKCVSTYLFNSQLLSDPGTGKMVLLCPAECQEDEVVKSYLDDLCSNHEILNEWVARDLRQSMKNGGGPACLRLRVRLTEEEENFVHPGLWLNPERLSQLRQIIEKHYPDTLCLADFCSSEVLDQIKTALDQIAQVMGLGSYYDFQR